MSPTATYGRAPRPAAEDLSLYQIGILALCVLAIMALAVESIGRLDPGSVAILEYADTAACVIFISDFAYSLYRAPNRWHYFVTWGWLDLLSSVPAIGVLRLGRAARAVRIIRVIRGVKSARALARFLIGRRAKAAFLGSALLCVLILVICSIAILEFEAPAGGAIKTADDALWWATSTMTMAGVADLSPITAEGRLVAVFLMVAGVGAFATVSGLVASWLLSPTAEATDQEVHVVHQSMDEVLRRLEAIEQKLTLATLSHRGDAV